MSLAIFTTPEAWISLITLFFLEIVLGVDNIVFIAITTNRLKESQQHLGRKLGLAAALIMRILFLCFASFLVHMTEPLFTIDLKSWVHGFSVRDIIMLGGGIYLIYKGISEIRSSLALEEEKAALEEDKNKHKHMLSLPQAIGTIMVIDLVFSIDSVITAVGLAEHLVVMIIAVMAAVFFMMALIDQISEFINKHAEMKILAVTFITVIGVLLTLDGLGINSGVEVLDMHAEKLMVYFAMVFAFVLELIQMRYNKNFNEWSRACWAENTKAQVDKLRQDMMEDFAKKEKALSKTADKSQGQLLSVSSSPQLVTPVFIGGKMYVIMPMTEEETSNFQTFLQHDPQYNNYMNKHVVIEEDASEDPIQAEFEDVTPDQP